MKGKRYGVNEYTSEQFQAVCDALQTGTQTVTIGTDISQFSGLHLSSGEEHRVMVEVIVRGN